jgi:UPF0271 protein
MHKYVVDMAGLSKAIKGKTYYTVPEILLEIHNPLEKAIVEAKICSGQILIREAKRKYYNLARLEAKKTGDVKVLSQADLKLLALFLEISNENDQVTLLTDDFALQNIAKNLKLKVRKIVGSEIRKIIFWKFYCPFCGNLFPSGYENELCSECGTKLVRKAIKKL